MKSVQIFIHSFVDLITNSSTEIYIQADQGTLDAIRKLVNDLLSVGDQKLGADDLFTFELLPNYRGAYVLVTPKSNAPNLVEAARVLSSLTSLFNIDAEYDG